MHDILGLLIPFRLGYTEDSVEIIRTSTTT